MSRQIGDLPHALDEEGDLGRRLRGQRPAVFLDYDGTLTPIVDRPKDAVISDSMRDAVSGLAERCPACVVSGRDRPVVQELMGLDNLIVAGSHGFDIWSPEDGAIEIEGGGDYEALIEEVKTQVEEELSGVEGASIEPKKASVAVHYRLASEDGRREIKDTVDSILAERPEELKMTPGKMVYEIQPKIDWDKGKAVLHLLETLDLNRDDVTPLYLGDDHTDEHAFEALEGRGIGIFVGQADDPEVAGRTTAADYVLYTMDEVEKFLDSLAR
ncbi:MAG: trehalose-phosphatase [Rubrobacteraceae bacterium]